ncbi:hypothetical protein C1645_733255 [Glomus cerebriforme]|uniref:Soluble NSF attachment protein n=1 Tax=Glomus cerebriforme TaxID=658196 RepID=A0A397TGM5_9GLOM|nr:hypothetical protein C1645_733255 [Glomus cerebriforme]
MFFLIFLIFIGYYFYKRKPDANSFREYILTNNSNSSSSSSQDLFKFFNKLLVGQPSVPEFKLEDYYCFSVVSFKDGTATYVGFLNKWYLWSKIEVVNSNGRGDRSRRKNSAQDIEGLAYGDKEAAIRAKGNKDYHTAARSFLSAAKRFKKIGDESNLLEAANCYEDAYKAFQQIKQTDKAFEALETAASIYERNERQSTRAARVYEILAEQYKKTNSSQFNLEKALKMHRKAADLFELDGDGSCDPSGFATACKEYDQLTTLTPCQTHILLGAKKNLEIEDLR